MVKVGIRTHSGDRVVPQAKGKTQGNEANEVQ